MLTRQRQDLLLKLLEEKGSITVSEVKDMLSASESTIRRDITALDQEGKLVKVFGGAVAADQKVTTHEYTVAQKSELNLEEKRMIAKYAASLIEPEDFVYLDAGTTTAYMLDYIEESQVSFVTNAVAHAQRLAMRGLKVILAGGELKASTEAVVGSQAMGQCRESYVLCDSSKFDHVSAVTFAPFSGVKFLTNQRISGYEDCDNVEVVYNA